MNSLDLFTTLLNSITPSSPVVTTTFGQVEGMVDRSRSGDTFYHFRGIPFAKPPLGDLRFRDPQPPEKWRGVRKTKSTPMYCIQMLSVMIPAFKNLFPPTGSEDCLYLSVATKSLSSQSKRPVLVYFHGGAYMGLAGSFWAPTYIMDWDQVVVVANYRLGTIGFLSFEDDELPGNMGLKDQNLVLKWVKDNIKNFGGDPNRVTIMGESAGAASVHYHALSPMSKGLFHQIIPLSGTAYALWAFNNPGDARNLAFEYAKKMGCRGDNSTVLVNCLRKFSAFSLVRGTTHLFGWWDMEPLKHIGPVFEKKRPGSFTLSSTKKWKPISVPMLTGHTTGEGLLKTLFYNSWFRAKNWRWISKHWDDALTFSFRIEHNPRHKEIVKNLKNYWFGGRDDLHDSDLKNFTNMYATAGMTSPLLHMIETSKAKVYYFKFNYLGEVSPAMLVSNPDYPKVPFHAEFIMYVMRNIFLPEFQGEDLEISRRFTSMIANFVIHGDPTPETGLWKPWTNSTYGELVIDNEGIRMNNGSFPEVVKHWRSQCAYEKFFGCDV